MILFNNQIINPGRFRTPQYNISPFSTEHIRKNDQLVRSLRDVDHELLSAKFGHFVFCENGRSAISLALEQYPLLPEDEIYIVTTSGNMYISSCVTQQIERFCKWSRELSARTKLIYVNHEFGVVYSEMAELKKLGIPIIEDMAMSMLSTDDAQTSGGYGDFTIYSLAKFFPMQHGGILKINNPDAVQKELPINPFLRDTLGKLLSHYLSDLESIKLKRLQNHHVFSSRMRSFGFHDRFVFKKHETPSVYMFSTEAATDLQGLKEFMQVNGVEASVFYGEPCFFIPVHQYLDEVDIDFIVTLIEYFFTEEDRVIKQQEESRVSTGFNNYL